eukprot:TRINITY_DN2746_c0_g1_i1.p1 TRINITY_DN2746_c0_g1~~TRINITY_DN2746_c0_g1_i1.p1  ORF type:complete len:297 (+),score=44.80 TRINITY_DN2746_c0_g1_i1:52-891(+)
MDKRPLQTPLQEIETEIDRLDLTTFHPSVGDEDLDLDDIADTVPLRPIDRDRIDYRNAPLNTPPAAHNNNDSGESASLHDHDDNISFLNNDRESRHVQFNDIDEIVTVPITQDPQTFDALPSRLSRLNRYTLMACLLLTALVMLLYYASVSYSRSAEDSILVPTCDTVDPSKTKLEIKSVVRKINNTIDAFTILRDSSSYIVLLNTCGELLSAQLTMPDKSTIIDGKWEPSASGRYVLSLPKNILSVPGNYSLSAYYTASSDHRRQELVDSPISIIVSI